MPEDAPKKSPIKGAILRDIGPTDSALSEKKE
jgi:hypothetical protein